MPNPVKPIPENFHTLTPNLVFRDAARAIEFYKNVFGAVELNRMPGPNNKVMHAHIKIGDSNVFINDTVTDKVPAAATDTQFIPAYLHVYVKDVDETVRLAVEGGARVDMPVQDMFWGDRYGRITDPFGQHWSIGTHTEDVTPDEMQRRMQAMSAKSAGQS
jgi:uncharacterized glyoxalase superfamily protein PhnB